LCLRVDTLCSFTILLFLGIVSACHLLVVLAFGIFSFRPRALGRIQWVV
jgi:hypothetical protein